MGGIGHCGGVRHTLGVGATAGQRFLPCRGGGLLVGDQIRKVHRKSRFGQTERGKIQVQAVVVEVRFDDPYHVRVYRAIDGNVRVEVLEHRFQHLRDGESAFLLAEDAFGDALEREVQGRRKGIDGGGLIGLDDQRIAFRTLHQQLDQRGNVDIVVPIAVQREAGGEVHSERARLGNTYEGAEVVFVLQLLVERDLGLIDGKGNGGHPGRFKLKVCLEELILVFVDKEGQRGIPKRGQRELTEARKLQKHVERLLGKERLDAVEAAAVIRHALIQVSVVEVDAKQDGGDGLRHGGRLDGLVFRSGRRFVLFHKGTDLVDLADKVDLIHLELQIKVRDADVQRAVGGLGAHVIEGEDLLIVEVVVYVVRVHDGDRKFAMREVDGFALDTDACLNVQPVVELQRLFGVEVYVATFKQAAEYAFEQAADGLVKVKLVALRRGSRKVDREVKIDRLDVVGVVFHLAVFVLTLHGAARHIDGDIGQSDLQIGIVLQANLGADAFAELQVDQTAVRVDGKVVADHLLAANGLFLGGDKGLDDVVAQLDLQLLNGVTGQMQAILICIGGDLLFHLEGGRGFAARLDDGDVVGAEGQGFKACARRPSDGAFCRVEVKQAAPLRLAVEHAAAALPFVTNGGNFAIGEVHAEEVATIARAEEEGLGIVILVGDHDGVVLFAESVERLGVEVGDTFRRDGEVIVVADGHQRGVQYRTAEVQDCGFFLYVKFDDTGQAGDQVLNVDRRRGAFAALFRRGRDAAAARDHRAEVKFQFKGFHAEEGLEVQAQDALAVVHAELLGISLGAVALLGDGIQSYVNFQTVQAFKAFRHVEGGADGQFVMSLERIDDADTHVEVVQQRGEGPGVAVHIGLILAQTVGEIRLKFHLCLQGIDGSVSIHPAKHVRKGRKQIGRGLLQINIEVAEADIRVELRDQSGDHFDAEAVADFGGGSGSKLSEGDGGVDLRQGDLDARHQQHAGKDLRGKRDRKFFIRKRDPIHQFEDVLRVEAT